MQFLDLFLEEIQDGMLFKIKKFLLPALIAISKHLNYDVFLEKVYGTFKTFNADEIWGVRKVCIENVANLMKYLKNDEIEKLNDEPSILTRFQIEMKNWGLTHGFGIQKRSTIVRSKKLITKIILNSIFYAK